MRSGLEESLCFHHSSKPNVSRFHSPRKAHSKDNGVSENAYLVRESTRHPIVRAESI